MYSFAYHLLNMLTLTDLNGHELELATDCEMDGDMMYVILTETVGNKCQLSMKNIIMICSRFRSNVCLGRTLNIVPDGVHRA